MPKVSAKRSKEIVNYPLPSLENFFTYYYIHKKEQSQIEILSQNRVPCNLFARKSHKEILYSEALKTSVINIFKSPIEIFMR